MYLVSGLSQFLFSVVAQSLRMNFTLVLDAVLNVQISRRQSGHHHHCHRSGREPRHIVISSVISTSSYHPSYPSLRNYFDCQINVTLIIWPELQPPTTTRRGISCQTMFVCSHHSEGWKEGFFPVPICICLFPWRGRGRCQHLHLCAVYTAVTSIVTPSPAEARSGEICTYNMILVLVDTT